METSVAVKSKPRWGLLLGLLVFFIGTPFLCYFIAALDGPDWTYALVIPVLYWSYPPAYVFGPRFFERVQYGYNPVGVAGWLTGLLFYAGIAILFWVAIRALSLRKPPTI
jgi:hypothetical protein